MNEQTLQTMIGAIRKEAMESGRTYAFPWVYKALKELGIVSYSVDMAVGQAIIRHRDVILKEEFPTNGFTFGAFNVQGVSDAIARHQRGETTYDVWMGEVAKAGVHRYIVSMAHDVVVYLDGDNTQLHIEPVPAV